MRRRSSSTMRIWMRRPKFSAANKFRNAGQVCVAPTRFLVQQDVYEPFVDRFVQAAKAIKLGNGLEDGTTMGPLANDRRVAAMESLVADAVQKGAMLRTGGKRIGQQRLFLRADRADGPRAGSAGACMRSRSGRWR